MTLPAPPDPPCARWQAQHLPVGVDPTMRAITADTVLPTTQTNAAAALPAAPRIPYVGSRGVAAGHGAPVPPRRAA
jgi:hypothetical protein